MTVFERLLKASFEGIEFLCPSESVDRGKKVVYHEYPNADIRYVEEFGKLPPTFNLPAIVHGDDAINRRFQLENKLEQRGQGLLVHPIYGSINVIATTFSVSSDDTEVGRFNFNIVFTQSRENITPSPTTPTAADVSSKAAIAREKINDAFENAYTKPNSVFNYDSIIDTAGDVFDAVKDSLNGVVELSADGSAAFDRQYRNITNSITRIVSDAQEIRQNITTFYAAYLDAPVFVEQLKNAWDNLLDYPFTVPTSSPKTTNQSQRQQNEIALIEHMKINALIGSYESKTATDFLTDDDLTLARQELDEYYKEAFTETNDSIEKIGLISIANDDDVKTAISDLRVVSRRVFDDKEKAIFRVVNIADNLSSMSLITYRYYGDLELIEKLIDLNSDVNSYHFNNPIKALSE